jgi:hypothetical protein
MGPRAADGIQLLLAKLTQSFKGIERIGSILMAELSG